ncbi:hypothetical protein [Nocardia wallacei]|uniref:hypothetical protein n=1 Tax=Nocardia wallacei TaxID=480035 RepID=UPI0024571699|nr:hypothetical protein [Nocardia wallacei]
MVEIVDQFDAADVFLYLVVDVGDRSFQGGDFLLALLVGVVGGLVSVLLEQSPAVSAEDVAVKEVVELGDQDVFADEVATRAGVPGGDVSLFWAADVVGDAVAGLAEHAALAQFAEQEGPEEVGPFGVWVFGVGSGAAAGAEAVVGDGLDLYEGFQVDEGFVDGVG